MAQVWQQSKLLNRFYEKIGKAAAGQGVSPKFSTFKAGYGLLTASTIAGDPPVLQSIPTDIDDVPGAFYTGSCSVSYSDGTVLVKCEIPKGSVSTATQCNIIGIYDGDGELMALCVTLPDWITPTEVYKAYPAVNFPIEEA